MKSALILAGGGRYADPWHDHHANALAVADLLAARDWTAQVRLDVDEALASISRSCATGPSQTGTPTVPDQLDAPPKPSDDFDLLVVCLGEAAAGTGPAPSAAADLGLRAWLGQGKPVLGLHAAASAFADCPEWERRLGAKWIPDQSYHPPLGPGRVLIDQDSPLAAGLDDFAIADEFYTGLSLADWVKPLAYHHRDGARQPLAWVSQTGASPLAYCALGHDLPSYRAPGHIALLGRLVEWLERAGDAA
ncbi:MAG: ThuA domain-containing protein [Bifidobacteriaceae bacterium]|nr:ThuA domain-containing protein [Bifidobacteriaceae bacterium]